MLNIIVKVNREDIIKQIENHKQNHIKEYYAAVKNYQKEKLWMASDTITKVTHWSNFTDVEDVKIDSNFGLTKPINNSKEYDKLINAFKMSVNEEIEMSFNDASDIANDSFQWVQQAKIINATYSAMKVR